MMDHDKVRISVQPNHARQSGRKFTYSFWNALLFPIISGLLRPVYKWVYSKDKKE